jgi:3'-phosphoadenosine 5'-phosphosulfate sulfotransferase (PAPS reductase)/FAD synthetase
LTKHIVSFSGGKDSTVMLLMMVEYGISIDEIVFCDTEKEFPQMYDHIEKVQKYIGQEITILREPGKFDYLMFDHVKTKGKHKGKRGYGWPYPRVR